MAPRWLLDIHVAMHPPGSRQPRYDLSYPLRKDSSGRYVFKTNLEVVLEKMKNAESMMVENEGIYKGPSYFLYGTKSSYQVYVFSKFFTIRLNVIKGGKEKHHILKHFPKAVFIPFETSKHFVHKEFPDLFVETVVKFIKQNEKK
ncbi:unnamed protein product [Larinioides sclopetarius]|uniref:Uncharacterized protein n=1 Tax=Larinioides sclopetarius TaxID=280406 RepID=A0AAV2A3A8_9ARAC